MKRAIAAALALAGCSKPLHCTAEVTDGSGMYRATARASSGEDDKALRRRTVLLACAALCKGRDDGGPACPARCSVDADAGKVGARVQCAR